MPKSISEYLLPSGEIREIVEGTFMAIVIYLVVKNAGGFSSIIKAISAAYAQGVGALQGRK